MRRFGIVVLALVTAVGIGACDSDDDEDDTIRFIAALNGANERPTAVTTTATGDATVLDNGATMAWTLNVSGIQNVTAAHIHFGGATVAGPVVVNLLPNGVPSPAVTTGVLSTGTITQASISGISGAAPISMDSLRVLMRTGQTYVNVHNTANTGGHIRGQLLLQ